MTILIEPIDQGNAWQVKNVDITNLTIDDYAKIRQWLMEKLILVFRDQPKDTYYHARLIHNIGWGKNGVASEESIGNWKSLWWNNTGEKVIEFLGSGLSSELPSREQYWASGYPWPEDYKDKPNDYPIQRVTGKKDKDGIHSGIFGKGKLLWHSNLNHIRFPDGVSLQGWEGCKNTSTEFLNTARCRADMDPNFVKDLHLAYGQYRISPDEWAEGIEDFQKTAMNLGAGVFRAWLLQTNRAGVKGIFFNPLNSAKLFSDIGDIWDKVYDHYFNEEYKYVHWWEEGDIVLMDQLLTLHQRGQHEQEILDVRVLNRFEFNISNYDFWMQKNNLIIPGRLSREEE